MWEGWNAQHRDDLTNKISNDSRAHPLAILPFPRLQGIKGNAKLNGRTGCVVGQADGGSAGVTRWEVEVGRDGPDADGTTRRLAIKTSNLIPCAIGTECWLRLSHLTLAFKGACEGCVVVRSGFNGYGRVELDEHSTPHAAAALEDVCCHSTALEGSVKVHPEGVAVMEGCVVICASVRRYLRLWRGSVCRSTHRRFVFH